LTGDGSFEDRKEAASETPEDEVDSIGIGRTEISARALSAGALSSKCEKPNLRGREFSDGSGIPLRDIAPARAAANR